MDILLRILRLLLCIGIGLCINIFIIRPIQRKKLREQYLAEHPEEQIKAQQERRKIYEQS